MIIYLFLLQLITTFRKLKGKIACSSVGKPEGTEQQLRRNGMHFSAALLLFPCIFSHLRQPGFVCCFASLAFIFSPGPYTSFSCLRWMLKKVSFLQLSILWKFMFFIYYSHLPLFNSEQEELGSAFTDWLHSRTVKREFSNSPKSKLLIILWNESWRINQ